MSTALIAVALTMLWHPGAAGMVDESEPEIAADRAIVVDAYFGPNDNTKGVLYAKNPDSPAGIGSVTKTMAMMIVFEELAAGNLTLNDAVGISFWASTCGDDLGLSSGQVFALETLLYGMMYASAGDATHAIAEYVMGGFESDGTGIEDFVQRMNDSAQDLGMTNTTYCGARGSCNSTPRDQAILWLHGLWHQGLETVRGPFRKFTQTGSVGPFWSSNPNENYSFSKSSLSSYEITGLRGWKNGWWTGQCDGGLPPC